MPPVAPSGNPLVSLRFPCFQRKTYDFKKGDVSIPIKSMYGIFTYIYQKNQPNVSKCRKIYHTWMVWDWREPDFSEASKNEKDTLLGTITYAPTSRHFWRWFSFSLCRIWIRSPGAYTHNLPKFPHSAPLVQNCWPPAQVLALALQLLLLVLQALAPCSLAMEQGHAYSPAKDASPNLAEMSRPLGNKIPELWGLILYTKRYPSHKHIKNLP